MKQTTVPILFLALACAMPGCTFLNANFRAVEDGRLYRSGQMHAAALERRIEENDIQTVISLRSASPDEAWYHDELAVCDALEVAHYSLGWSKNRLPTPEALQKFIGLVEEGNGAVIVHCQGGVHRTSVAAAVYVLLRGGGMAAAQAQIAPGFDDAPIGRLLDLFAGSEEPFGEWASDTYPKLYPEARAFDR